MNSKTLVGELRPGRVQVKTEVVSAALPEDRVLWAGFVLLGEPSFFFRTFFFLFFFPGVLLIAGGSTGPPNSESWRAEV